MVEVRVRVEGPNRILVNSLQHRLKSILALTTIVDPNDISPGNMALENAARNVLMDPPRSVRLPQEATSSMIPLIC